MAFWPTRGVRTLVGRPTGWHDGPANAIGRAHMAMAQGGDGVREKTDGVVSVWSRTGTVAVGRGSPVVLTTGGGSGDTIKRATTSSSRRTR